MRNTVKMVISGLATIALTLALAAGAQAASSPTTPVHLSSAQVAQALFVAGDVGRLSQIPSGTESVVLEKVLQQLYADNPALPSSQAVSDIQGLQAALSSGSQAISPATLTVMAGNERILAILRALTGSNPPGEVQQALALLTGQALSASSQSAQFLGQAFDAEADSLDTLSFNSFSPAGVLAATAALASANNPFGQARDTLWKQASSESVFDSAQTLVGENPALQNSAVRALVGMLNPDGSLDTTVGALENVINGGLQQVGNQNCALAPGASGTNPSDCSSGALHDAQLVAQACPNGTNDTSAGCQSARTQAAGDATNEVNVINAEQAADAAAAAALDQADQTLGLAESAESQAASQVAEEENQYLNYQSTQQFEKAGFDVANLAVTLSVSEIDPVAAVSGLLNVVGDALGFSFSGPDPNTIILQGIQNVSQQISDFEQYTQSAFHAIDTQLSNISTQVSQLAAQITQAQQQLTQLATTIGTLQSSVDHLQSEVQSLFAQNARNDLATLINQYIGYQQTNGVPLSQSQFATAAGALVQDATGTALTQTVLNIPTAFDALDANALVTGTDPFTLDSNINLFNLYGAEVADAPGVSWPGALSTTCAPNADLAHGLCLPDPDFWATSARAFAQLLLENPSYVTPTRITQLNAIQQDGQLIANALHQLSADNAGSDPGGTGNSTLDAAINYFRYWGDRTSHPGGTPPSLWQAIKNEEQTYLASQHVPADPALSYTGIDPWGAAFQSPDLAGIQTTSSFANLPVCPGTFGTDVNPSVYTLHKVFQPMIAFLDPDVLNAVRLGLGTISDCWTVIVGNVQTGANGVPIFDLHMTLTYTYTGNDGTSGEVGNIQAVYPSAPDCRYSGDPNTLGLDAYATVTAGWGAGASPDPNCPDLTSVLDVSSNQMPEDPVDVITDARTAVSNELSVLRQAVYSNVINMGAGLTAGDSQADNVQMAATRLSGANALMDGYISLGLPQALADDDALHSLVAGVNAVTFDPASGGLPGTAPATDVPTQVINLYRAAIADDGPSVEAVTDPADLIANLVDQRSVQLSNTIRAHIAGAGVPAGVVQSHVRLGARIATAQTTAAVFAEENPYLGPTLDRLDETAFVLSNEPNGATATTSPTPSTPTATMPAAPVTVATVTTAPAKCTLKATTNKVLLAAPKGKPKKGAPKVKPGTVSLTARCNQGGTVRLTGTLTQLIGSRPQHGEQRSKTYRLRALNGSVRAGRLLTLTVKLPAAAVTALGHGAKESVRFTLTATNANGRARATARIATLRGTR